MYKGGEPISGKPSQPKNLKNIRHIIIHHSATPKSWTINDFVAHRLQTGATGSSKYSGLGYNYILFPLERKIVQDVKDEEYTWSTGGYNSYSLALCVAGYYHAPKNDTVTDEMINILVDKCAELCAKYNLDPMKSIIGHRDVAKIINNPKWATACPGDLLWAKLPLIRTKVKQKLDQSILPKSFEDKGELIYDPNLYNEDWDDETLP